MRLSEDEKKQLKVILEDTYEPIALLRSGLNLQTEKVQILQDKFVETFNAVDEIDIPDNLKRNLKISLLYNFLQNSVESESMEIVLKNNNLQAEFDTITYKTNVLDSYEKLISDNNFVSNNTNPFDIHTKSTLIPPFTTDEEIISINNKLQSQLENIEKNQPRHTDFLVTLANDLLSSKTPNPALNVLILPKIKKELKKGKLSSETNIEFIESLVSTLNEEAGMNINLEYKEERALKHILESGSLTSRELNKQLKDSGLKGLSENEWRGLKEEFLQLSFNSDSDKLKEALLKIKKEMQDGNDGYDNPAVSNNQIQNYDRSPKTGGKGR